MAPQKKKEVKLTFSPREAAAYLHRLAADLMHGRVEVAPGQPPPSGAVEVKQSRRFRSDGTSVDIRIRFLSPVNAPGLDTSLSAVEAGGLLGQERPGIDQVSAPAHDPNALKKLKKELQDRFKEIKAALEAGRMPSIETVESFNAHAASMTELPFVSREDIQRFLDGAETLSRAFKAGDSMAFTKAAAELGEMMSQCHAKYK